MKELLKALAAFQDEVPVIYKGTEGYGYNYADMGNIFEIIKPLLKTHGLAFTQVLDGKNIKTILFHVESGETLEGSLEIDTSVKLGNMNTYQVFGAAVTYYRRYSLSCMLGLVTDEDGDGQEKKCKTTPTPTTPPVKKEVKKQPNKDKSPISDANFNLALKGTKIQIQNVIDQYQLSESQTEVLKGAKKKAK